MNRFPIWSVYRRGRWRSWVLTWVLGLGVLLLGVLLLGVALPVAARPGDMVPAVSPSRTPRSDALRPYLERLRQQVSQFRLANGMTFLILERHEAPVISFVTYANVGSVDEQPGQTGIAHFLEHLAFKGTQTLGTTDYTAEASVLAQMDQTFTQIQQLRQAQGLDTPESQATLARLDARLAALKTQAAQYVRQNELGQVIEREGGVGLNAATSTDATTYFYSLPANKLELWMALESERFLQPVFREFYEEREVILEERRSRLENDPVSQLLEAIKAKAFSRHPYRNAIIGDREDIQNLTRQQVQEFFATHYGPENLTVAIVGDVEPNQVRQLAQAYFGRLPSRPRRVAPPPSEPPQTAEQQVSLTLPSQPWYMEAYHIPAVNDPDYLAYSVLGNLLSSGRTSRLYRSLVEGQRLALAAQGFTGYPGEKYPNLLLFYCLPAPGQSVDAVATALRQELERLRTEPVSVTELDRVKTQIRAGVLRSLTSNQGMAQTLAEYQVLRGDWRSLFQDLEAIAALTPADMQRVAQTAFRAENRTVGRLIPSS